MSRLTRMQYGTEPWIEQGFLFSLPSQSFEEWDDVIHGLVALNGRRERDANCDV
jgi:hypothetical protein